MVATVPYGDRGLVALAGGPPSQGKPILGVSIRHIPPQVQWVNCILLFEYGDP